MNSPARSAVSCCRCEISRTAAIRFSLIPWRSTSGSLDGKSPEPCVSTSENGGQYAACGGQSYRAISRARSAAGCALPFAILLVSDTSFRCRFDRADVTMKRSLAHLERRRGESRLAPGKLGICQLDAEQVF